MQYVKLNLKFKFWSIAYVVINKYAETKLILSASSFKEEEEEEEEEKEKEKRKELKRKDFALAK